MPFRFIKFVQGGPILERITDGIAILAVITGINPTVYFWLSEISAIAALLMPILGCLWLAVQIYSRMAAGR